MTKFQQNIYDRYIASNLIYLTDCYINYSDAKYEAYINCREQQELDIDTTFRIISYNTFMFSCAYVFKKSNGDWYLKYFTPRKVREWRI